MQLFAQRSGGFVLPVERSPCQDVRSSLARLSMSTQGPDPSQHSAVSGRQLALIVYILYFLSYFTGITAVIGVIIAHVQLASADALLSTHYRFQIRTFWIGLLYLAIGIALTSAVIGIAVLFWWFVWSLVRNVKGVLALNENKLIVNPGSWMFG
jgi:uncharacterized membrane protein